MPTQKRRSLRSGGRLWRTPLLSEQIIPPPISSLACFQLSKLVPLAQIFLIIFDKLRRSFGHFLYTLYGIPLGPGQLMIWLCGQCPEIPAMCVPLHLAQLLGNSSTSDFELESVPDFSWPRSVFLKLHGSFTNCARLFSFIRRCCRRYSALLTLHSCSRSLFVISLTK